MESFSVEFPAGAAVCAAGDYLLPRRSAGGSEVYRVDDLVLLKRLVPSLSDPSTLLIEEHTLDSITPAYVNEVHLLLTALDPDVFGAQAALEPVQLQALPEGVKGLLRRAGEFAGAEWRVVRSPAPPA